MTSYKKAEPKLSQYRERYKQHKIGVRELITIPPPPKIVRTDSELNGYSDKGDRLFFGPGVEEDI